MKMQRIDTTTEEWFPNINNAIETNGIKAFPTAKLAKKTAKEFGWTNKIIRCDRRFEHCYIIGSINFRAESIAGVIQNTLSVPILNYVHSKQSVIIFRKVRK